MQDSTSFSGFQAEPGYQTRMVHCEVKITFHRIKSCKPLFPQKMATTVRHIQFYTGCTQNTEKWFSMTFQDLFMCIFQNFPGPLMSILHVFPGLFNRVNIEQAGFSYNIEYVTQFIIILNNRSNRVWQRTMIMYVKAKKMYTGQKCSNHLVYFHDFPGPRPHSMTPGLENLNFKFCDLPGSVCILFICLRRLLTYNFCSDNFFYPQ